MTYYSMKFRLFCYMLKSTVVKVMVRLLFNIILSLIILFKNVYPVIIIYNQIAKVLKLDFDTLQTIR